MKKLLVVLVILAFVVAAYATVYQAYSAALVTKWSTSFGGTYTPTILTTMTSGQDPTPWQKLDVINDCVKPNPDLSYTGNIFFKDTFYYYGSIPAIHLSKATIWVTMEDFSPSDYFRVYVLPVSGGFMWMTPIIYCKDTLFRFDLVDYLDEQSAGWYKIIIQTYSAAPRQRRINYYFSYDRVQEATASIQVRSEYALISIPMRFYGAPTPSLSGIFPGTTIFGAWVFNPFTETFDAISYTAPLVGSLGDVVRTNSIFLLSTGYSGNLTGYPVEQQKYHDLRCDYWGSTQLYPVGSVWSSVPFNWTTGQPDDLYNLVTRTAYIYDPTAPPPGYVPDPSYSIERFEGHLVNFDNAFTAPPYDKNGHLDLTGVWLALVDARTIAVAEGEESETDGDITAVTDSIVADMSNPFLGSYPPSGFDRNGLPLPPSVPDVYFAKRIAQLPKELAVSVSPNPFNSSVGIKISVPADISGSDVALIICDLSGKMVHQSSATIQNAHTFIWNGICDDGTAAGTGVYLYSVRIGKLALSGRICLLR